MTMRRQSGFTIVEVLVAVMMVSVGVLSTIGVFISSQKLSLVAERQTTLTHRAQQELERLQSVGYSKLLMTAAPTHSTDPSNPDYYVTSTGSFQYDRSNAAKTESLAIDATNGTISPTPTPWTDPTNSRINGNVYDFVSWVSDPSCGPGCSANSDKRVTVVVSMNGVAHPSKPVIVSTIVPDPGAAPVGAPKNSLQNPLDSPATSCQVGTNADGSAILGSCTNGVSGTPIINYLYDTATLNSSTGAEVTTRQTINGDHGTHQTIASVSSGLLGVLCNVLNLGLLTFTGCQDPNLMAPTPPPNPGTTPPLYKYSSDVTGDTYAGGQILKKDVSCTSAPSWSTGTNENKGDFWVTNALASNTVLNGSGGATLYLQNANGVTANVTVCLGLYVAPQTILGLLSTPPVQVAAVAVANAAVGSLPTPVTFSFNAAFGTTNGQANTYTFLAGKRIGIRVWIAASVGDVAIAYDHPQFASVVQVNAQ